MSTGCWAGSRVGTVAGWMRRVRCMQRDAMLSTGVGWRVGCCSLQRFWQTGRSFLGLFSGVPVCSGAALPSVSSRRFVPRVRHVRGQTNYSVLYIQLLYIHTS